MAEENDKNSEVIDRKPSGSTPDVQTSPLFAGLIEAHKVAQEAAVKLASAVQTPAFQRFLRQIDSVLERIMIQAAPVLEALSKIDWHEVHAKIESLPSRSKNAMNKAAEQGWFFGWNGSLADVISLVDGVDELSAIELDDFLAQYHRDNLDAYSSALMSKYPSRMPAINAAIEAHKTGTPSGYLLAIPVLIAQADGVLSEVTETESALQKAERNKDQLRAAKWLQEKLSDNARSLDLVHPILNLHSQDLFKSSRQRTKAANASGQEFSALNRHQVMHGEVSDYGNELNSLKAFSFLVFVGLHLPYILADMSSEPLSEEQVTETPAP